MDDQSRPPAPGPLASVTAEVDHSLLDWYAQLSVVERLRAATRAAATLDRLAAAAVT